MKIISIILLVLALRDYILIIPKLEVTMRMADTKEWPLHLLIKCQEFQKLMLQLIGDSLLLVFLIGWWIK